MVNLQIKADGYYSNQRNYAVDQEHLIVMSGDAPRPSVFRVRVVDKASGAGVTDYEIVYRYRTKAIVVSNQQGRWQSSVEPRSRGISATLYSVEPAPLTVKLETYSPDSSEEQVFELDRGSPPRGRAFDAQTGKPLSGVHILNGDAGKARYFIWDERDKFADGHHSLTVVQRTISGDDGSFAFSEGDRKGTLFLIHPGYARLTLQPDRRGDEDGEGFISVALELEATVSGRLFGSLAERTNVFVQLYKIQHGATLNEEFERIPLQPNSGFQFTNLGPGDYSLAVYRSEDTIGFSALSRKFTLQAYEQKTVNMGQNMGQYTLTGTATPFTLISLHPQFEWEYPVWQHMPTPMVSIGSKVCVGDPAMFA